MDAATRAALQQREERLIREFSELPDDAEDKANDLLEEIAVIQSILCECF